MTRLKLRRPACETKSSSSLSPNLKRTAWLKATRSSETAALMSHRHSVMARIISRTTALERRNRRRVAHCHRLLGHNEADLRRDSGSNHQSRIFCSPSFHLGSTLAYCALIDSGIYLASSLSLIRLCPSPAFTRFIPFCISRNIDRSYKHLNRSSLASAYRTPWTKIAAQLRVL